MLYLQTQIRNKKNERPWNLLIIPCLIRYIISSVNALYTITKIDFPFIIIYGRAKKWLQVQVR